MKKLLFFLFGLLLLAGCGKDSENKPKNLADAVAGQYTLTAYSNGAGTVSFPFTNKDGITTSGTVSVAATAGQQNQVDLTLTIKQTGKANSSDTFPGLLVKAAGQGYELLESGQKVGTVEGNTLTIIDGADIITAKK